MTRRTAVGLGVIVVLAVTTYAIFTQALPWSQRWTVDAVFTDGTQVRTGSPVRIAGVQVGQVRQVERGPGNTAKLTLEIKDNGRPVHRDATAEIKPRLFLEGSYYIDLRPGTPGSPDLARNGTIPLPQTKTPVQFSPVLSTLTHPVRRSLSKVIEEGSISLRDGGAEGLHRGIESFPEALRTSAIALEAGRGTRDGDLTRLVQGASRVTGALADQAPALGSAITDANRVATALSADDDDLRQTVEGVDQTVRVSPPALTAIENSLPSVRRFSDDVAPAVRIAPGVLRRTVPALDQVRGLSRPGELPAALDLVRPVSTRLTRLYPLLRELLPRTARVSKCAGNQGVDVLNAKVDDGALSTGQPNWQEFAHASVSGNSVTQNFDGNGNEFRASLNLNLNALSLGSVPGVGFLVGDATKPITGVRPTWEGPTPPTFRPDVSCVDQKLPSFASPVGPADTGSARGTIPRSVIPTNKQLQTEVPKLVELLAARAAKRKAKP